jgi:hypothetical protein
MKSWQRFLLAFGCICAFTLIFILGACVRKTRSPQIIYEYRPEPNPHPIPPMSPIPRHPEKVLDWYKRHVYWDPTVPKPERIELLHKWNENKRKTRRANGKNILSTLNP